MHKIIQNLVSIGFIITLIVALCACGGMPPFIVNANEAEEELLAQATNPTVSDDVLETPTEEITPESTDPIPEPTQPQETESEEVIDETKPTENETIPEETEPEETEAPTQPSQEEPEPTKPPKKETEQPKPTEPKPTEPKPQPTEPEPTEPPTEPEETTPPVEEPEETYPPAQPEPEEPQPTEPPVETQPPEPTVNYTEVDEYLYVTATSLNVRKGPGTQYDRVTSLSQNTKVHRIAIGDNGWSKIDLDGQVLFVHSSYLSTEKVTPPPTPSKPSSSETVAEEIARRGMTCRLRMPSVGFTVACFWSTSNNLQTLVDNSDSAAFFPLHNDVRVIADHRHQGFSAMKNSSIGDKAYLEYADRTETYTCIANFKGHNTSSELTDNDGNNVADMYPGKLIMYTCNENWQNITITVWE